MINREVLISSTLMLVFFTTIVFGALMPFFIKFFQSLDITDETKVLNTEHHYIELDTLKTGVEFGYLHPNFSSE